MTTSTDPVAQARLTARLPAHVDRVTERRAGVVRCAVAVAATAAATLALLLSARGLWLGGSGTLDALVGTGVLVVGAVAGAVLTVGSLLLLAGASCRAIGLASQRWERAAARLTPALLRRAVAVAVSAGVGLGAAAGTATAVEEPDLGWAVTSSASQGGTSGQELARAAEPDQTDQPDQPDQPDHPGHLDVRVADGPTTPAPAVDKTVGDGAPASGGDPADAPSVEAATSPTTAEPPSAPGVAQGSAATVDVGLEAGLGADAAAPVSPPETSPAAGAEGRTAEGRPRPEPTTTTAAVVTVQAGDSLWSIAQAHLPQGSDDTDVAAAWPRWYEANRTVLGEDPDLIHPGQALVAPTTSAALPSGPSGSTPAEDRS